MSHVAAPQKPQLATVPRVDLSLKTTCGCGFSSRTLREGEDHARATGHTLHISGEIRASR